MVAALVSDPSTVTQEVPQSAPAAGSCTLDVFEALGDQGEWLTLPDYGPAWHPRESEVGSEFVPFVTGGFWALRDGRQHFSSRWSWGEVVFSSGRWTLHAKEGWLWIPDARCVKQADAQLAANGDPSPLPPLLNPIKVRTIKHPLGTLFAFPFGREWGRVFPPGVAVPMSTWVTPIPSQPGTPTKTVLFPSQGR